MSWLEDMIAQLQGGATPAAYSPAPSAFPDIVAPPSFMDGVGEIARGAADRLGEKFRSGEAPARLATGMLPFGIGHGLDLARNIYSPGKGENMPARMPAGYVPMGNGDLSRAAIDLAMNQAPPGTGVPGPLGEPPISAAELAMMPNARGAIRAGEPDGTPFGGVPDLSQFAPMSIAMPPSVQAAKTMTGPPGGAPAAVPHIGAPGSAPGVMAGPAAPPEEERATDFSATQRQAAAPMSIFAPASEGPSRWQRIGDEINRMGPMLMAMGGGMAGAPSLAEGISRGLTAGAPYAAARQKREEDLALQREGQNATARWLLAKGAPAEEVAAAIRSPELLKAMIGRYGETKAPQVVGGRLVREQPDGTIKVLADYSKEDEKAPTQREIKLPNGAVQQQEWDKKAQKWNNVGEPAPGERDRRLSVSDVTKLSEEGQKMDQVRGFATGFKPEFAGWKVNTIGDLATLAGRNLPESVVGKSAAEASAWWQEYDRYKNVVRHGLYGASLTKGEQAAFLKADITPGMDPAQVQRNLATQQRLVENSIRRKGKALIGSTYDKDAIAKAFGVEPSFFDQEDTPAGPRRSGTIKIGGQDIGWSLN